MTRGTTAAHVARAVIESIAYQVRDVFDAMQEDAGISLSSLLADGGATRNDQLMQFQADILNCAVLRNSSPEVSPLGAAFLAGLGTGFWSKLEDVAALPRQFERFEPRMPDSNALSSTADGKRRWRVPEGRFQQRNGFGSDSASQS